MSEPMTDSGPEKRLDFTIEAELGTTAGVRSAAVTLFSWRKEKTAMERKHGGMVFWQYSSTQSSFSLNACCDRIVSRDNANL